MKKYAGIGSRSTPPDVLELMTQFGAWFADEGWMLRSGRARGADRAFETGCGRFPKEIFTADPMPPLEWYDHAAQFHPAWDRCDGYARALHARNSAIVLGANLNDPVDLVMCWTVDGKATGGTGQAMRIAAHHGIPIINLQHVDWRDQLMRLLP